MRSKPAILGGNPVFEKPVPFSRPTLPPYEELEEGLRSIIDTGMVTKGNFLNRFEEELKRFLEVPHTLGVVNCTLGLFMLLKSLKIRGEVIVPSFSFMSSFHVVEMAGLTPVFVDCERETFTLDPSAVEDAITEKTSAIMGVNIFGNPPDVNALEKIARENGLKFIMDSAHSFGTLYLGKPMGRSGDGEVFSTSATKLLATGEGGVITTTHPEVEEYVRIFREYGNTGDYNPVVAGINGRMSEFHALLGLKLLPRIEEFAEKRNRIARIYKENLTNLPGIIFQKIRDGCRSSFKDFCILIDQVQFGLTRDQLRKALKYEKIDTRRYFYPPGHRQKYYRKYARRSAGDLTNTDFIANHSLNLPIYSHMNPDTAVKVIEAVERIYRFRDDIAKMEVDVAHQIV